MEVYKILKRDHDGLTSVSEHHPHTFEPGQVTVSLEAPLFVFTDLGWAKAWYRRKPFCELWKVEVDYIWDVPRIIHTMELGLADPDIVHAWWRNEVELKTMPPFHGTKVAPAVRLIKCMPLGTAIVRLGRAEAGGP